MKKKLTDHQKLVIHSVHNGYPEDCGNPPVFKDDQTMCDVYSFVDRHGDLFVLVFEASWYDEDEFNGYGNIYLQTGDAHWDNKFPVFFYVDFDKEEEGFAPATIGLGPLNISPEVHMFVTAALLANRVLSDSGTLDFDKLTDYERMSLDGIIPDEDDTELKEYSDVLLPEGHIDKLDKEIEKYQ